MLPVRCCSWRMNGGAGSARHARLSPRGQGVSHGRWRMNGAARGSARHARSSPRGQGVSHGRWRMNASRAKLSKTEPMRFFVFPFLGCLAATMSIFAANPEVSPTPTVSAPAAEQGKDVVHALNNAFAKVFET